MANTANPRRVSADGVERALAVILLALLGTYALSRVGGGSSAVIDGVGVVAIHVSVVVAGLFPLVVLADAASSRVRSTAGPHRSEVVAAAVGLGALGAGLGVLLGGSSLLSTALLGCAAVALLVLVGLVVRRP